ncbi:MAG: hypothetical protein AAF711_08675 [Planctomycetota bacterium]
MSQFPSSSNTPQSAPAGSGQLVLVGLVIAAVAVILMNVYVEMRVAAQEEDTITFFKFRDEMKVGDTIEPEDLKPVRIPKSMEDAFGLSAIREDPDDRGKPLDGLGGTLGTSVSPDQILTFSVLSGKTTSSFRDPADRGLDEITLTIDSKNQPPNLRPGDFVDIFASVPLNRSTKSMRIMEYVKVVNLGDRIIETGTRSTSNKYGSITIYVDPTLSGKLQDIQKFVRGQTFNVTRRDPQDKAPRELERGGSKEINKEVLDILNLN